MSLRDYQLNKRNFVNGNERIKKNTKLRLVMKTKLLIEMLAVSLMAMASQAAHVVLPGGAKKDGTAIRAKPDGRRQRRDQAQRAVAEIGLGEVVGAQRRGVIGRQRDQVVEDARPRRRCSGIPGGTSAAYFTSDT